MMIFADKRYSRHDKRSILSGWILSHLHDAHLNLSTDMALHIAHEFLRKMAQPYDKTGSGGKRTCRIWPRSTCRIWPRTPWRCETERERKGEQRVLYSVARGVNGSNTNRTVVFLYLYSYFINEYEFKYCQIRI